MASVTTKNIPIPDGTDPASQGDDAIRLLADWVNDNPGVAPMTAAAIAALTGPDVWAGRTLYDTDNQNLQVHQGSRVITFLNPAERVFAATNFK